LAGDGVFVITGASTGIGAATARMAADAGFRLVLAARSHERLAALADELGGEQRALPVAMDVTAWDDQKRLVDAALSAFGRIDVVFANAGIGTERGFAASTPERWREMILTNVYGSALTIRAARSALLSSRGHLLLTGSVAGRRVGVGSVYSCTKWAVSAMGEAARLELHEFGVRVTLIQPGMTQTEFFDEPPTEALAAEDVARAVMYAVTQPEHVAVNEILMRPRTQET
jgi:NADP-dependent 3-hydroxy acid dehydrogenase YdfG